jgi:hypothetical protein
MEVGRSDVSITTASRPREQEGWLPGEFKIDVMEVDFGFIY